MNALQLVNYNWITVYYLFVNLPCPCSFPCSQYPSAILLAIIIIMCISIITHRYADSVESISSFFELPDSESLISSCAYVLHNSDFLQLEIWLVVRKQAQSGECIRCNLKVLTIKEWGVEVERSGCNH